MNLRKDHLHTSTDHHEVCCVCHRQGVQSRVGRVGVIMALVEVSWEWAGRAAHRQGLQLVGRGISSRPAELDHVPRFSFRDMASTSGVTTYTTATFNVGFFGWDDDEGCSKLR